MYVYYVSMYVYMSVYTHLSFSCSSCIYLHFGFETFISLSHFSFALTLFHVLHLFIVDFLVVVVVTCTRNEQKKKNK